MMEEPAWLGVWRELSDDAFGIFCDSCMRMLHSLEDETLESFIAEHPEPGMWCFFDKDGPRADQAVSSDVIAMLRERKLLSEVAIKGQRELPTVLIASYRALFVYVKVQLEHHLEARPMDILQKVLEEQKAEPDPQKLSRGAFRIRQMMKRNEIEF